MQDGDVLLSTAMSANVRWLLGSKDATEGHVISPDLKNPKKHVQAAAHSMIVSGSLA